MKQRPAARVPGWGPPRHSPPKPLAAPAMPPSLLRLPRSSATSAALSRATGCGPLRPPSPPSPRSVPNYGPRSPGPAPLPRLPRRLPSASPRCLPHPEAAAAPGVTSESLAEARGAQVRPWRPWRRRWPGDTLYGRALSRVRPSGTGTCVTRAPRPLPARGSSVPDKPAPGDALRLFAGSTDPAALPCHPCSGRADLRAAACRPSLGGGKPEKEMERRGFSFRVGSSPGAAERVLFSATL